MMRTSKTVLISVIILSIFLVSIPRAQAFGLPDVFYVALKAKQYWSFWRGIRSELTNLSEQVTEQILEGDKTQDPNGEPAYVEYWRDFIGESRFRGENVFRVQFNETPVCDYMKESLQMIYGVGELDQPDGEGLPAQYDTKAARTRVHPYELTARCTLASIEGAGDNEGAGDKGNQGKFLSAWINAGDPLGAYAELSRTSNNFYGAWLMADEEFETQSEFEKEKDVLEILANAGIRGIKDTGEEDEPGCLKDTQGRCVVLGKISTPGKVLAEAAAKTITAEFDIITNRNEGHFKSIIGSLIEKFLNFNTGTGFEGGDDDGSGIGFVSLTEEEGHLYQTDFRDARNYSACVRDCEEDNPPKKADGCAEAAQGDGCFICIGRDSEDEGFECVSWERVPCAGAGILGLNCDIEDINADDRARCIEDCNDKWLWPDYNTQEEDQVYCPEGTTKQGASARNGTEFLDDAPVDATGRVFHNCGKGFGGGTGDIGIWTKPPATCEEAGFAPGEYVGQIATKIPRATNISTYCLGRRGTWTDGPPERPRESGWFDVNARLNVISTYKCSGDPEDGYWIDLPGEGLWHGAYGPEGADSTICQ
jgi:hypothetical protein